MNTHLISLIAVYLLSGFVSTQVALPPTQQLSIRLTLAGLAALPLIKWRALFRLSARSALLCVLVGVSGYGVGAWAFIHAISLGGYATAVFITSLPWLGILDLAIRGRDVCSKERVALFVSGVGCVIFFLPSIYGTEPKNSQYDVIFWSCVSSLAVSFAQYARRFHDPHVSSSSVADGVILTALMLGVASSSPVTQSLTLTDGVWLILGALSYLASNRLSNVVFKVVSPSKAAVALSSEPAIALGLSALFLEFRFNAVELAGAVMLIVATRLASAKVTAGHRESTLSLESNSSLDTLEKLKVENCAG